MSLCYFSHKCCLPLMSINIQNAFTVKLSEIPLWIFYIVYLKLEIFLRRKVELMKMGENFYVSPIDVHRHSKCFYRQTFWDPTIYTYIYIYIYILSLLVAFGNNRMFSHRESGNISRIWEHLNVWIFIQRVICYNMHFHTIRKWMLYQGSTVASINEKLGIILLIDFDMFWLTVYLSTGNDRVDKVSNWLDTCHDNVLEDEEVRFVFLILSGNFAK